MLGDHGISINQVVQGGEHDAGKPVTLVITTHEARESDVQNALASVAKLPACVEKTRLIRILDH